MAQRRWRQLLLRSVLAVLAAGAAGLWWVDSAPAADTAGSWWQLPMPPVAPLLAGVESPPGAAPPGVFPQGEVPRPALRLRAAHEVLPASAELAEVSTTLMREQDSYTLRVDLSALPVWVHIACLGDGQVVVEVHDSAGGLAQRSPLACDLSVLTHEFRDPLGPGALVRVQAHARGWVTVAHQLSGPPPG